MILEEYLTRLGFKLDDESYRKFMAGVQRAGAAAVDLGVTVAGAATVVATSIGQIAKQYDALYFASQRTKASVADIKAGEFGFRQIGLTADQSRAQVEGFAQAMRMNPGLRGLLRGMGITTENAQEASTQLIGRLRAQFGEQGYFVAARMAQMYGIDETTFKQQWTNFEELKRQQAAYRARLQESGVDTQKLAQDSRDFNKALDGVLASMGLIADQTAQKWLPSMTKAISAFDDWVRWAVQMGKETNGFTSTIISLVAALASLKVAGAALGAVGLGGVGGFLSVLASRLGIAGAAVAGGVYLADQANKKSPGAVIGADASLDLLPSFQSPENRKKQAVAYFMSQGWSRQQAVGIVASMWGESKLKEHAYNPAGGGKGAIGIAQWRGDRQDQFKKLFGKDLRNATFEEQLKFAQWELTNSEAAAGDMIKRAGTAGQAAMLHSRLYERHGSAAEDQRRAALADQWAAGALGSSPAGGAQVIVSQKTEIKVEGSGDPAQVAAKVSDSQGRVNGDLVRNVQGAVR